MIRCKRLWRPCGPRRGECFDLRRQRLQIIFGQAARRIQDFLKHIQTRHHGKALSLQKIFPAWGDAPRNWPIA